MTIDEGRAGDMNNTAGAIPATHVPTAADLAGLEPLKVIRSRWPMIVGGVLTLAMIAGVLRALLASGLGGFGQALPRDPLFWVCTGLVYLSLPVGDFIIFRRLWAIPASGLVALIKKRIANEVLFGYSGEAYFYTWARARSTMVAAPFGAVKDVSILSAIAGNAMTLLLIALSVPLAHTLLTAGMLRTVQLAAAVTLAMSLPFLLFSRRVFSLPRAECWWIFGVHVGRLVAGTVLSALAWHFALPAVSVAMWLFLSAGRLLVSRLPFITNKDMLFANFAVLLLGPHVPLARLIALTAAITLVIHLVLIGVFSAQGALTRTRAW